MGKKIKGNKPRKDQHESFFVRIEAAYSDEDGLVPMKVDGIPFKVKGNIGRALHVEVAANITQQQADRISKVVEEASGHPPLVLGSNIRLMRLRRISEEQARQLVMAAEAKRKGEEPGAVSGLAEAEAEFKRAAAETAVVHEPGDVSGVLVPSVEGQEARGDTTIIDPEGAELPGEKGEAP